jgi:hypothetical protein
VIELNRIENMSENDLENREKEGTTILLNDENEFKYQETKKLNLSWQNLHIELTSQVANKNNVKQCFKKQNSELESVSSYRTIINNGKKNRYNFTVIILLVKLFKIKI